MIPAFTKLYAVIGVILGSAVVGSVVGRIIHAMNRDKKFVVSRSPTDRRSGNQIAAPWRSDTGLTFVDRRVTPDRRVVGFR